LRTNGPTEALEHLSRVVPQTRDEHLATWRISSKGGRSTDASRGGGSGGVSVGRWRGSKAQTAHLALALALARNGERAEAERAGLVAVTMEPGYDPWLDYGDGDARFWRHILFALRQALK
jgi:hypothetical protein